MNYEENELCEFGKEQENCPIAQQLGDCPINCQEIFLIDENNIE